MDQISGIPFPVSDMMEVASAAKRIKTLDSLDSLDNSSVLPVSCLYGGAHLNAEMHATCSLP